MQLRSAAVPGRSKVDSMKSPDFSGWIGVTIWCAGWETDQSFMKTIGLRCLPVAAPEDGRTPSASFRLSPRSDQLQQRPGACFGEGRVVDCAIHLDYQDVFAKVRLDR